MILSPHEPPGYLVEKVWLGILENGFRVPRGLFVVEENGPAQLLGRLVKPHRPAVRGVKSARGAVDNRPLEAKLVPQGPDVIEAYLIALRVHHRKTRHLLPVLAHVLAQPLVDLFGRPPRPGKDYAHVNRLGRYKMLGCRHLVRLDVYVCMAVYYHNPVSTPFIFIAAIGCCSPTLY